MWVAIAAAGVLCSATEPTNDPVKDYISHFSFYDGRNNLYSDDKLLRLDLDLNNNGQKEVLLSMGRDQNGKQGNVWVVYTKTQSGYVNIGGMTFSASGFYLGEIAELGGRYGLVTFWPAGAGEGALLAYVYDGSTIQEAQIGEIRRDPVTRELKGTDLVSRYFGTNAIVGDDVITPIDAAQLAKEYGITVEPKTYAQAVQEGLPGSTPIEVAPAPSATPSVAQSTPALATPTLAPVGKLTPITSPTLSGETKRPTSSLPIILITTIAVLIVGAVALLVRKRP
jgi:hypothetical protein